MQVLRTGATLAPPELLPVAPMLSAAATTDFARPTRPRLGGIKKFITLHTSDHQALFRRSRLPWNFFWVVLHVASLPVAWAFFGLVRLSWALRPSTLVRTGQ